MIKILQRLEDKLKLNREWQTNVNKVIENVEALYITTPYFFPKYTNHGVVHVNDILQIANNLIPEDSLTAITEKELGVYLISLILHDIGMYVSYDAFCQMIEDKNAFADLEHEKTVGASWQEYLLSIKHFSEKQLINSFGTTEIQSVVLGDEGDLNNKTRLVIGEFLRQHHHNIAHNIILHGISGFDYLAGTSVDAATRDLIGLIARSHGMDIRDTEHYLKSKYARISKPKNISIFYIMTLVRIADYLDVGVERAPHIIRVFYAENNNISRHEFDWNECLRFDDFVWDKDREYISIDAAPENAKQFISIERWVKGVQYELDLCWAIIGEHYGADASSGRKCEMSIRRIDANILKKEVIAEYEEKFHTKEAHLDANADILKLLISPLYGDNPSFGVRELLQNAVDACREREKIERDRYPEQVPLTYKGAVTISLDTKQKKMTFVDNGTGMNIGVIKNYYLVAGASYRRSNAWSKVFSDKEGNSTVLRNGKFGVGVLATFLLGEKAIVTTKSIDDELGWEFTIQLDQCNIELKRVLAPIGTRIEISLTDKIIEKLKLMDNSFDVPGWCCWYKGDTPEIAYQIDDQFIKYDKSKDTTDWHELKQNDYSKYYWSYDNKPKWRKREACCNDIRIPQGVGWKRNDKKYRFNIAVPHIKTEDLTGKMPVNLARTALLEIPCERELYRECCKYALAKFLNMNISKDEYRKGGIYRFENIYLGNKRRMKWDERSGNIIFAKNGYTLYDAAFLSMAGINSVNLLFIDERYETVENEIVNFGKAYMMTMWYPESNHKRLQSFMIDEDESAMAVLEDNIVAEILSLYFMKNAFGEDIELLRKLVHGYSEKGWEVKVDECKYAISHPKINGAEGNVLFNKYIPMIAELRLNVKDLNKDDAMLSILQEYLQPNCFIPYDMEDRKKMFPKAFKELEQYM